MSLPIGRNPAAQMWDTVTGTTTATCTLTAGQAYQRDTLIVIDHILATIKAGGAGDVTLDIGEPIGTIVAGETVAGAVYVTFDIDFGAGLPCWDLSESDNPVASGNVTVGITGPASSTQARTIVTFHYEDPAMRKR
jgi:hypothetical protein